MSGLTQGLDVLSLASQVDPDTQTTLDSVLENADAATLLRLAIERVGREESQDITAEGVDPVREYPSSDDVNDNDNDQVEEPRAEQYPSQHHGFQVENPLPLQPQGNSQQNELHYAPYTYPSQTNGYPIPINQQTYPPLQYTPAQNFQSQNYAGAYVHQYPPQFVAQSLTVSHGPMVHHPQYPNAQPLYAPTYPQGYPVQASTAVQPVAQPHQTNPGRRRKKDSQEHKHPCPICTKRFLRPSALVSHMRTHTGEKPFPCRFAGCDRTEAFSVKSNRTRHEGKHIREEMPPPPEVLQEINARRVKNGMAPLTLQAPS